MDQATEQAIEKVSNALCNATRVGVLTGAGMSAASGLPTYRGIGGLYNDIEVEAGMPIEEILHAYTLARNPALTWKYVAQIGEACRGASPNEGHRILAAWAARFDLMIATQNVDGFHRAAGSADVIELHGNLSEVYCLDCEKRFTPDIVDVERLPPRCADCDGLIRPNAVLFGEMLPLEALARYEREVATGFNVLIALGTTAGFPYIQDPMIAAGARGTLTVEINPDRTVLSDHVQVCVTLPAVEALQAIDQRLNKS